MNGFALFGDRSWPVNLSLCFAQMVPSAEVGVSKAMTAFLAGAFAASATWLLLTSWVQNHRAKRGSSSGRTAASGGYSDNNGFSLGWWGDAGSSAGDCGGWLGGDSDCGSGDGGGDGGGGD
jgi:hypothetical protein